MTAPYRAFYGFKAEPFSNEIATKDLLKLPAMVGVKERFDYCLSLGGVMVVTGEVGGGKSTSLRWTLSHFHPSEMAVIEIVANTGSITEFYRQLARGLDLDAKTGSRTLLLEKAKVAIRDLAGGKRQKVVLIVDEASLLRAEILAELHTLMHFDHDAKNMMSLVLSGHASLVDRLTYRSSAPLASRVIAKTHLAALTPTQMEEYVGHHLRIAGVKKNLFDAGAITAIHQGSAGVLRKANSLARGALVAAASEKQELVTAEHVRISASELM